MTENTIIETLTRFGFTRRTNELDPFVISNIFVKDNVEVCVRHLFDEFEHKSSIELFVYLTNLFISKATPSPTDSLNLDGIKPHKVVGDWHDCSKQVIEINDYEYDIGNLITSVRDLEPFDLPIKGLNIDYHSPCENSVRSFSTHMVACLQADLDYPIILSPTGIIMDGRHRLVKALILGKETIKAVQLEEWPSGTYVGQ